MDVKRLTWIFVYSLILLFVHTTSASGYDDGSNNYFNQANDVITTAYTGLATWIIVVIVIVCLIVVAIIVTIIVCCVCCARSSTRRPAPGQVLQPLGTIAVSATSVQHPHPSGWEMNQGGVTNQGYPMRPSQPQPAPTVPTHYHQASPPYKKY